MPVDHREIAFEAAIEDSLLTSGGYAKADPANFDRQRAVDPTVLVPFIQETQPDLWASLESIHGADTETVLLDDLCKAMDSQGSLNVIRHGFKCFGKLFRVAYFAPAHGMNPDTQRLYPANRLTITRQLHSARHTKSPRPGAGHQRLARGHGGTEEPADRPDGRACQAGSTWTTATRGAAVPVQEADAGPLRRGSRRGLHDHPPGGRRDLLPALQPGNGTVAPAIPRTRAATRRPTCGSRSGSGTLPRHPGPVHAPGGRGASRTGRADGQGDDDLSPLPPAGRGAETGGGRPARRAGQNYLVQHSAGSGKSNSIAWLAHRLASLHDDKDDKVFDSVMVITDRLVLDQQLQDTIYQFEHKQGVVVRRSTRTPTSLAEALDDGTPIIITTLQKFPFVHGQDRGPARAGSTR